MKSKQPIISFLSILTLLVTNSFAQKTVIVNANYDGWVNTGIDIVYGESFVIIAGGIATTSGDGSAIDIIELWGGPAGAAGKPNPASSQFLAPGLNQMELVGKISSSGTLFLVGTLFKTVASKGGRLYLAYNDAPGGFNTNKGLFVAFIFAQNTMTTMNLQDEIKPTTFSLQQNYPNPFNPTTKIDYELKRQSHTVLKNYNSLGEKVKTLVDGIQNPGKYSINWNGVDDKGLALPTGQYYYQLYTGNKFISKKALLLK